MFVAPLPALSIKHCSSCHSKQRKKPIKGATYLTGERGSAVCITTKERVIWRCLSWTGSFPVSGTAKNIQKEKNPAEAESIHVLVSHVTCHIQQTKLNFWLTAKPKHIHFSCTFSLRLNLINPARLCIGRRTVHQTRRGCIGLGLLHTHAEKPSEHSEAPLCCLRSLRRWPCCVR